MSENPYGPLTIRFGDLRYVDKAMHDAWQQGHDSRDAEVAALKAERDAAIREVGEANRALGALQLRYETELLALKKEIETLKKERDDQPLW